MADANVLSDLAKEQLFQLFREFQARTRNTRGHRATYFHTEPNWWVGKTTTAHDKDATETVDLYSGDTKGSETKTDDDVEAYNRFADVATGKWCIVIFIGGGWELIAAEC